MVVVDEQLRAHTPSKISRQHLDDVDDGQDEASTSPATTTPAHRASPFDHLLHFSHQSSTLSSVSSAPTPSSTTSSTPSTSRNNSPTPPPGPCVVLPRPVRPNTSLSSSALPAYPPLHHPTTTAAYPYPAYYPLTSFANNPSAGPEATTSLATSSSNTSTLPPPVPMLTTPGAGPVIDLQFLSQLYLQASPYLLPGLFSTATATTSSSSTSSSSTTMSGGHHQQAPPPGYHPGIHLQQQVFHQAMALAQLHPLPLHQHHHHQQHISPPASVHRESSTALAPITPARSLDRHVPNHQHQQHQHHDHQRHQSAGLRAGGDRMSALESILARAERHAQEENARNLARGIKREKSEPRYGDDDYASPSRLDRIKRRRTDSNSSDSDYSPSSAGSQRRTQSDDDEHHHRGQPTFTSSSSGSSDDDEDDESGGGARRAAGKHQGVVGTGMREMLYKRRQASPKQVVLLEQVFAVEPIPTSATKLRLSEVLNMSPKRVTVWFKNKRARQKKKGIPLPNSCTTATTTATTASTGATSSPGGPTTTSSVRTSPIDRKFATSSASSSSSTTAACSSPPSARRRGDQHLTFHYFADRDGDDSAAAP